VEERPKYCTLPDCFNCPYPDCIFEQMTIEDYMAQRELDKEFKERSISPVSQYQRAYYLKHRDEILKRNREWRIRTGFKDTKDHSEYQQQYRADHAEEIRLLKKRHHEEHREMDLERMKQYYADNADRIKAYQKQYYQEHHERILERKREAYRKKRLELKDVAG